MLIDYTYFRGDINIAQLSQATVLSTVNEFIEKYEPKVLKQLLGLAFYEIFIAEVDPISGTVDQRWLDLLNGKVYTYHDKSYEWMGFVNTQKDSIIANYVYFWFTRKEVQHTTGMGQVSPATENGYRASMMNTGVRAWNEAVDWAYTLVQFLDAHAAIYPEWVPYSHSRFFLTDNYGRNNHWPEIFQRINHLNL